MSSTVTTIFRSVKAIFVWTPDLATSGQIEKWKRPAPASDGKIYDDCDGFAIECWERLHETGFHPRLAVCRTEDADPAVLGYNHCVCLIEENGTFLVLDNRQAEVVVIEDLPYTQWARQVGSIADPWESFSIEH